MPNKTLVKTHYPDIHCETILTEVFPEKRLQFTGEADAAVASAAVDFAIEDGKTYIVSIDREEYEAVAASGEVKTSRGSISTEAGQMTVKLDAKEAGSHTVRVTTSERNLCKNPDDFLPEHLQFGDGAKAFEPIVWGGNTEGLEQFAYGVGLNYYKIGEYVGLEQVKSMYFRAKHNGAPMEMDLTADVTEDAHGWLSMVLVASDGQLYSDAGVMPAGLWVIDFSAVGFTEGYLEINPASTVKPMDEKYMPILTSPGGKKYKIAVTDDGTLTTTAVS